MYETRRAVPDEFKGLCRELRAINHRLEGPSLREGEIIHTEYFCVLTGDNCVGDEGLNQEVFEGEKESFNLGIALRCPVSRETKDKNFLIKSLQGSFVFSRL